MFAMHKGRQRAPQLALLLLLVGLAFWFLYRPGSWTDPQYDPPDLPSDSRADSRYVPVLGKREDRARLYFPPKSPYSRSLQIARYVEPPSLRPRTPLFIGFTNNNAMLMQCVLSYIAAGWPPEDIVVVENTPTMDSNARGKLPETNYFYLDYRALRKHGVSVLQTPVLFTFGQLQNFYLRTALAQNWKTFFWSHMDVIAVGDEGHENFRPFYHRIVDVVSSVQDKDDWAIKWFSCTLGVKACDMLVLVSVDAWRKIGQWDPFIPYYISDCDAFSRMVLNGYSRKSAGDHIGAGHIFDVGSLLDDPEKWLFPTTPDEQPNSDRYTRLFEKLEQMEHGKLSGALHRNDWQEHHGDSELGAGVWDYDQKAFRAGWWTTSEVGREMYQKKWGTNKCELETEGVKLDQMWKPLYEEEASKEKAGEAEKTKATPKKDAETMKQR